MKNELLGILIGLAKALDGSTGLENENTNSIFRKCLKEIENDSDEDTIRACIDLANAEKKRVAPNCFYCASPCLRTSNYDTNALNALPEELKELKLHLLSGAKALAAKTKNDDPVIDEYIRTALLAIGYETYEKHDLVSMLDMFNRSWIHSI